MAQILLSLTQTPVWGDVAASTPNLPHSAMTVFSSWPTYQRTLWGNRTALHPEPQTPSDLRPLRSDLLKAPQVQHRVADQLARSMEGDESSSVGVVDVGPKQPEPIQYWTRVRFVPDPSGVDWQVLAEQQRMGRTRPVPVSVDLLQPQTLLIGHQAQTDHLHQGPGGLHPELQRDQIQSEPTSSEVWLILTRIGSSQDSSKCSDVLSGRAGNISGSSSCSFNSFREAGEPKWRAESYRIPLRFYSILDFPRHRTGPEPAVRTNRSNLTCRTSHWVRLLGFTGCSQKRAASGGNSDSPSCRTRSSVLVRSRQQVNLKPDPGTHLSTSPSAHPSPLPVSCGIRVGFRFRAALSTGNTPSPS